MNENELVYIPFNLVLQGISVTHNSLILQGNCMKTLNYIFDNMVGQTTLSYSTL